MGRREAAINQRAVLTGICRNVSPARTPTFILDERFVLREVGHSDGVDGGRQTLMTQAPRNVDQLHRRAPMFTCDSFQRSGGNQAFRHERDAWLQVGVDGNDRFPHGRGRRKPRWAASSRRTASFAGE